MYFNAKEEKSTLGGFGVLAAGVYPMFVEECEEKADQHGNDYIKLVLMVHEGSSKGRKLFQNLYLNHPEWEGAVSRGRATMKALCQAANIEALRGPADLKKLIGLEVEVKVGIFKDKNTINGITALTKEKAKDLPWN